MDVPYTELRMQWAFEPPIREQASLLRHIECAQDTP